MQSAKNEKKIILITGSEGNVGLAMQKISNIYNHQIFGCDLHHKKSDNYMRADIGEYREIEKCIKEFNPSIIINLAGEFGRWNGEDFYEKVWKTNAIGLKNLIRLQNEHGFRLVHASSSEVYGDFKGTMNESVMDKFPIRQLNDYAISKWVNEQQIQNSIDMHNLDSIIFRIFNTYGPGEEFNEYRSAVSRFIHCCLNNEPYTVYSGHERTHTYIDDCARMIFEISLRGVSGEAYNLAGPDRTSMTQINKMIEEISGTKSINCKISTNPEPHTTAIKIVSNEKFTRLMNNSFEFTPLSEGLENTIKWYKNLI